MLAGILAQHLDLPALRLGIAAVHAQQVAGEDRRLVAAGTGADLEKYVALVARIVRHQQPLQLGIVLLQARLTRAEFLLAQRAHVGIGVGQHVLCAGQFLLQTPIVGECRSGRLQASVLDREVPELLGVAKHFGVGEQVSELFEALLGLFELLADRWFHLRL